LSVVICCDIGRLGVPWIGVEGTGFDICQSGCGAATEALGADTGAGVDIGAGVGESPPGPFGAPV